MKVKNRFHDFIDAAGVPGGASCGGIRSCKPGVLGFVFWGLFRGYKYVILSMFVFCFFSVRVGKEVTCFYRRAFCLQPFSKTR